jgi:dipeptidyl aminopeptidase/acylaminoacyl peptidase
MVVNAELTGTTIAYLRGGNVKKAIEIITLTLLSMSCMAAIAAQGRVGKRFTVADDVGLTLLQALAVTSPRVQFSPDRNYLAVYAEHGRLDLNEVEDFLRFYRTRDIEEFVQRPDVQAPSPVWIVNRADKEGPVINDWRWLQDSSGVAFLEGGGEFGNKRLVLADLRTKEVQTLSTPGMLTSFDIRDRQHYLYAVADPAPDQKLSPEPQEGATLGTGRSVSDLLFPDDPMVKSASSTRRLWAVLGNRRFEVKPANGASFASWANFVLSPDAESVVTLQVIPDVPVSWENLYPPPFASSPKRIRPGRQDLQPSWLAAYQYVWIRLQTGSVQSLTEAPWSGGGWYAGGAPSWSSDGQAILLPGTFLESKDHVASRPCVAVVELPSKRSSCVETLTGRSETRVEPHHHLVTDARFIDGDKRQVVVSFEQYPAHLTGSKEYRRAADGVWLAVWQGTGESELGPRGLEVKVEQSLDRRPVLVARKEQRSRVIWDPNPQLKDIDLGEVRVYKWKDKHGRDRLGGLYRPSDFKPSQRYPLVIQTHAFTAAEFRPSGLYPMAFAATELATAGILVLQVQDEDCATLTPSEGACVVSAYEGAAKQLASEGFVDPDEIGIIGFSRSCFYVMETLTMSSLHIKAAAVTDGLMGGYSEYLFFDSGPRVYGSLFGAQPFGEGLSQWLKRAPGFNLDKVTAPLLVAGAGRQSLLYMWESYAALRYQHKPVELVILDTHEHPSLNPAVRMASQGGSVDWFRFWLQGYENPDPAKAEQYRRWETLCDMQVEQNPNQAAFCVRSNTH